MNEVMPIPSEISNSRHGHGDYNVNTSRVLDAYGFTYTRSENYLLVGHLQQKHGWILYISVIWTQLSELLAVVLPILKDKNLSFQVARSTRAAILLANGSLGHHLLGKILSVYPVSDTSAREAGRLLREATYGFRGPVVPSSFRLGKILYARYESFDVPRFRPWETSVAFSEAPTYLTWPFDGTIAALATKEKKFIHDRYRVIAVLKNDAKGRAFKCLRLNGFKLSWHLVKEGKHDLCVDAAGRDIRDRIRWQFELHKKLFGKVLLPAAVDQFDEDGNAYMVTEFIQGHTLRDAVDKIYGSRCWLTLDAKNKSVILGYLLQVIESIESLHTCGYVHRDITPGNFLIDTRGRLLITDLELAYCFELGEPNPPFAFGTEGFMSPEQQATSAYPSVKEDVYGLGALIIFLLTKIHPLKFETGNVPVLEGSLNFFLQSKSLSTALSSCLAVDPSKRPELSQLKEVVKQAAGEIQVARRENLPDLVSEFFSGEHLANVLIECLWALEGPELIKSGMLWHSNTVQKHQEIVNRPMGTSHYVGLREGISGVLYVISRCKMAEVSLTTSPQIIDAACRNLFDTCRNTSQPVEPGLFSGSYGIAIALASAIDAGLIAADAEIIECIQKCLGASTEGYNLANGAAGKGMALLCCLPFLSHAFAKEEMQTVVDTLLQQQQSDGSWLSSSGNQKPLKVSGYGYGVAGILCFMIAHYSQFHDECVRTSLIKGLTWLKRTVKRKKDNVFWYRDNKKSTIDIWLMEGISGIALCFIKAYEALGQADYKTLAEEVLWTFPRMYVSGRLSLAEGIAGLGEVYLEAHVAFGGDEWLIRANAISQQLLHTSRFLEGRRYWIVEDNSNPTADFMIGNSGILHFLLRQLKTGNTPFPLFPK